MSNHHHIIGIYDNNRILGSEHQLGGFEGRAKPGLVVDAQLVDVTQTTKLLLKRLKISTINQSLAEITQEMNFKLAR